MIIKKKENCIEGGNRSWFLATCDYASLQARLASIDTFLNENPEEKFYSPEKSNTKPDQTLFEVYKDGSTTSDLHSMTGFGTFVGSTHMKAIRVHDDVDNKDYVFAPKSKCKVEQNGQEVTCFATELQVTDHIIEHLKK